MGHHTKITCKKEIMSFPNSSFFFLVQPGRISPAVGPFSKSLGAVPALWSIDVAAAYSAGVLWANPSCRYVCISMG